MENHRCGRSAGDIVAKIQNGNSVNDVSETMDVRSTNQSFLATKEAMSNGKAHIDYESKLNDSRKLFQPKLGSSPPNKRAPSSLFPDLTPSDRSKAVGDMFYKTKLCCEFEVGSCLFMDKCVFAHGMEELRKLPIYEEQLFDSSKQMKKIFQVQSPLFVSEKLNEEGCEYGKKCFSFRNELAEDRKSESICLLPGNGSKSFTQDSNWKTKITTSGSYPGGAHMEKNVILHGNAELRGYDRELVNSGPGNSSAQPSIRDIAGPASVVPRRWNRDQRVGNVAQMAREAPIRRWKGPDKISKIYGDWIDDL